MIIRKAHKEEAIKNNQESDKVIIDGLMTTEELTEMGQRAAINTKDVLMRMYPKNPELEIKELDMINDEAFNQRLAQLTETNSEGIEAFYANQKLKDKINQTRNEIQKLNKKYRTTKEQNLIYEQNRKIEELTNQLKEAREKANIKS